MKNGPPWARAVASGLGSGFFPKAPGTCGTIAAAVFFSLTLPLLALESWVGKLGLIAAYTIGALASTAAVLPTATDTKAAHSGRPPPKTDPQWIVIDEWAGLSVTILAANYQLRSPTEALWSLFAVILFRIFDIWKPLGVRSVERLPGSLGIVADDLLAGCYATLILVSLRSFA